MKGIETRLRILKRREEDFERGRENRKSNMMNRAARAASVHPAQREGDTDFIRSNISNVKHHSHKYKIIHLQNNPYDHPTSNQK